MLSDPDFYFEKEKARLAAVKKLQDKYNQDAIILQEVMKQVSYLWSFDYK